MPRVVRAAIVEEAGADPIVQEVGLAGLEPDEVYVEIDSAGICHTDVAYAAGELWHEFPVILGHEMAGTVGEVGSGVRSFKTGDRVVIGADRHCGHCGQCEAGHAVLCTEGRELPERTRRIFRGDVPVLQSAGGYMEATIAKEETLIPIPDDVPFEVAAVAGCAVATGLGAVMNIAKVRPGTTAAVIGCGGVGVNIIMGCKVSGAETIVAVDPNEQRRGQAVALGATQGEVSDEDALREIAPDGFDYVFECAGKIPAIEMAVRITKRGGTMVLIGAPPLGATFDVDALEFVVSQRKLLGCLRGDLHPRLDFAKWFGLYRRGMLAFDTLISQTMPLDDITKGFELNQSSSGLRTVLKM